MKRSSVISCLLFMGLFVSQIFAHTTTGECGTAYTAKDRGGSAYQVCHYGNLPTAFNNKVSSIWIPKGFNMRLFKDSGRVGQWIDIKAGVWNAPPEWDKVISSVLYNNWGECATFYSGASQTGKSFLACETGNLVAGYNDQIASVSLPARHFFRFFKEPNQQGDYYDVRGKWNLKADFVNQVKSMKYQHWSDCVSTYTGLNRGGKLFLLCDSGAYLPTGYDNMIRSISVPKKVTLTLYKEPNYKGASIKITEGLWNAPAGWDKTISSIKLSIEGAMTSTD